MTDEEYYFGLASTCLFHIRDGLVGFVDLKAKQWHQVNCLMKINPYPLLHCERRCGECTFVHNTYRCEVSPFLHAKREKCRKCTEIECDTCNNKYCSVCDIVNLEHGRDFCGSDILVGCKYCHEDYCTACANVFCRHTQMKCHVCKKLHCRIKETEVPECHSHTCDMTDCSICDNKYCKHCKKLDCTVCTCSLSQIMPDHKRSRCPVPTYTACNCRKNKTRECLTSSCGIIYDTILTDHINGDPCFKDSDPSQWLNSYWEPMKCFLSNNKHLKKPSSSDNADLSSLLNICINSKRISCSINNLQNFKEVSEYIIMNQFPRSYN